MEFPVAKLPPDRIVPPRADTALANALLHCNADDARGKHLVRALRSARIMRRRARAEPEETPP